MAMPPGADHREHARLRQSREMGAGGLRRDSRRSGELARGQGAAIEERRRHRCSRRVSDQRRDLGDDGAGDHPRTLPPAPVPRPAMPPRERRARRGGASRGDAHARRQPRFTRRWPTSDASRSREMERQVSDGGGDRCDGIPMDVLIAAAARALAAGDPLGALQRVALREDAPALALRGIAMAQLGDLGRAKALLRRAGRAFGSTEAVARARCVVAEAEIALVSRDLGWPTKALDAARATLEAHGDRVNAAHARCLEVRLLLLMGRLDEAERTLADLDPAPLTPASRTAHELVVAGIAIRRLRTKEARDALVRAERAARDARIPALTAEVESASLVLNTPAARLIAC